MILPYNHDEPLTAGGLRNKLKGVSNDTPIFIVLDKSDENQAHTAKKAKESHLKNGTYPPKGIVNDNIAKGAPFRFKPGRKIH